MTPFNMSANPAREEGPALATRPLPAPRAQARFVERLREIDMFFQGSDPIHQTMRRVAARFEQANICYAIVGGMAEEMRREDEYEARQDQAFEVQGEQEHS